MIYFTSDTHFFHGNIITYCNRPFHNYHEMNATLIENWNKTVQPEDFVYHLGDFGFRKPEDNVQIVNSLNGKKILIIGNHDKKALKLYHQEGCFEEIHQTLNLSLSSEKIVLFHYPIHEWEGMFHGAWHFHGHNHATSIDLDRAAKKCFNVGVDAWSFTPICFEQIREFHLQFKDRV